jgi:hypothetical protein
MAEHDGEQDRGGARVCRGARETFQAKGRVDHRMRTAGGKRIVAEVDHLVRYAPLLCDQRCLVAQGAAREQPAQRAGSRVGHAPWPGRPARHRVA